MARKESLERELKEIRDALDADIEVDAAPKKSALDNATIANPCPKSWADMQGDDKVRFCGGCKKNVYNVIAMSRVEAEELLGQGDVCARLFKRPDGTVMTADCAPGRWRRRGQKAVAIAAAAGLSATAIYAASEAAMNKGGNPGCENPKAATSAPVKFGKRPSALRPNTAVPVVAEPPQPALMGEMAAPVEVMGDVAMPQPPQHLMGRIKAPR